MLASVSILFRSLASFWLWTHLLSTAQKPVLGWVECLSVCMLLVALGLHLQALISRQRTLKGRAGISVLPWSLHCHHCVIKPLTKYSSVVQEMGWNHWTWWGKRQIRHFSPKIKDTSKRIEDDSDKESHVKKSLWVSQIVICELPVNTVATKTDANVY